MPKLVVPPEQRPGWDDHFYKMAQLVGSRSRDDCPVGAVLVGEDHVVLATGYNGLPRRVADLEVRLKKKEKLRWTVHAEENAICNAACVGMRLKGSTLYVTKFPCSRCAGALVQAGIVRVFTQCKSLWKNDPSGDDGRRSIRIMLEAGVAVHAPEISIAETKREARRRKPRPVRAA